MKYLKYWIMTLLLIIGLTFPNNTNNELSYNNIENNEAGIYPEPYADWDHLIAFDDDGDAECETDADCAGGEVCLDGECDSDDDSDDDGTGDDDAGDDAADDDTDEDTDDDDCDNSGEGSCDDDAADEDTDEDT
ncbi:MAG TPA: hypothetical protein EYQ40_04220, partial [Candidatus Marinimicrobia bacterium]|nr:hypothetical protein [Candidatus Neomarinimicrobiota bacterium]